jgi:hypothetical protein
MNTSTEIAQLSAALVHAQCEIPNIALDKTVQYKGVNFQYASLSNIIANTKPTLAKHGLVVVQYPKTSESMLCVVTRLLHSSGEWLESELSAKVNLEDPKLIGSWLSYLRRYSMTALLGISHESDMDAKTIETLYDGSDDHKRWLRDILSPMGVNSAEALRSIHDYMLKNHFELTQEAALCAMEKLR